LTRNCREGSTGVTQHDSGCTWSLTAAQRWYRLGATMPEPPELHCGENSDGSIREANELCQSWRGHPFSRLNRFCSQVNVSHGSFAEQQADQSSGDCFSRRCLGRLASRVSHQMISEGWPLATFFSAQPDCSPSLRMSAMLCRTILPSFEWRNAVFVWSVFLVPTQAIPWARNARTVEVILVCSIVWSGHVNLITWSVTRVY
jgi:hypothetical protein